MREAARRMLAIAALVALAALLVGGRLGSWAFVVASLVFPPALIILGAARRGRPRVALFGALFLFWLESCALVVLLGSGGRIALAAMLLGLAAVPLLVVPWVHARFFDETRGSR